MYRVHCIFCEIILDLLFLNLSILGSAAGSVKTKQIEIFMISFGDRIRIHKDDDLDTERNLITPSAVTKTLWRFNLSGTV